MPDTIERLTARLTALEDRQAIADLIAGYGPAVDTLDGPATASLWADAGKYDIAPDMLLEGRAAISGIATLDQHRGYVAQGCGHLLSPHRIVVTGATATAQGYSMVVLHDPGSGTWQVARASANLWHLRKTDDGWQVVTRKVRLLDGDDEARALLTWAPPAGDPT